jgi:hypothetical protein
MNSHSRAELLAIILGIIYCAAVIIWAVCK